MSILGGSVVGKPGIRDPFGATHRIVMRGSPDLWLPGGATIAGAYSRDPGNTGDVHVLRAGLIMGKRTADSKMAPTVLGVLSEAYTSGGTELTVTAAQATEIARRVGSSGTGTLKAIGPPSAAGTVAATAITFSAVDTTTGVITVTSLGVNKVAGTFITAADGSENPLAPIWDGMGIRVTDADGDDVDVDWPKVPVGGVLISANLIPWPEDASLRTWLRDELSKNGKFVLDHAYN
jgi:hypothetical protein